MGFPKARLAAAGSTPSRHGRLHEMPNIGTPGADALQELGRRPEFEPRASFGSEKRAARVPSRRGYNGG